MTDQTTESGFKFLNKLGLSGNLQGVLFIVLSGVGFTVYLLINKMISDDVHWTVLSFFRAVFGLSVLAPIILFSGFGIMRTRKIHLVFFRSVLSTIGMTLAIFAVSDAFTLSLAQFNAISFTRPLFVTILAAIVLKESVGLQRWSAVSVGFLGVLIMVTPETFMFWKTTTSQAFTFDGGALVALISAFSLAGAIILVKFLSAELKPLALLIYANFLSLVLLLPFAIWFAAPISLENCGWIALMGLFGLSAQFCYITAISVGEASFVSPADYVRLPMSVVADFLVFRFIPGANIWIGALIIVGSTLYISIRERLKNVPPR